MCSGDYVDLHLLFGLLLVVSDYKYLIVVLYTTIHHRGGNISRMCCLGNRLQHRMRERGG